MLKEARYQGELNESILYDYNADFRVSSLSYAGGQTNLSYDADGLLTGINGFAITRHQDHGLPTNVSDGVFDQSLVYNAYGEMAAVTNTVGGNATYSYELEHNSVGQIIGKTETLPSGAEIEYRYEYDDNYRLTGVYKNDQQVETYQYDANGNRTLATSLEIGISAQSASFNLGDQLEGAGDSTYEYDANGRLSKKTTSTPEGNEVTTYEYSSQGRLKRVETPEHVIEYRHNAMGNRVAKLKNGEVVEHYLWQDKTTLLATYDGEGNLKQRFEYTLGHTPTSFTENGEIYFVLSDQLGSPRIIADSAGQVIKAIEYDAYGNVIADSQPSLTIPFGFGGGIKDVDTGLIRFGYRDYLPSTGRWTARDPISFTGGDTNLYGYVLGNPINFVDPFGLAPNWVGPTAAVIGATGGGLIGIGIATGNPIAAAVGLGLSAVAGGLTIWDWATKPVEMIDNIKNGEDMKQIEESMKNLKELNGGFNNSDGEGASCPN
ncbi:RHS repeat domain-containing protein [Marinobacter fonticola]|uniref:RHS repeat domain-containing protein n=1 Tax=Marinobacter fonticola TaxID=2603215 RepID=UPI0011E7B4FE|nr:RHS repeat-associated core domain-containing protein [Marinobacter fonticola]